MERTKPRSYLFVLTTFFFFSLFQPLHAQATCNIAPSLTDVCGDGYAYQKTLSSKPALLFLLTTTA